MPCLYCRVKWALVVWRSALLTMVGCCLAVMTTAVISSDVPVPHDLRGVATAGANKSPGTDHGWNQPPEPFDTNAHYSREVFVSPVGLDTEGDGSIGHPFRTIRRALESVDPGTRISILPGVYPAVGTVRGLAGTPERPIAIVGSGEAVIDTDGESVGLHLSDPHYIVIEGLTFRNAWPHGLNIDDGGTHESPAHHVILRDLRFLNIGKGGNNDCVKLSGVEEFQILSSTFERCDHGEAIDMVGCRNGVVSRNAFRTIPRNAVQTKGGSRDILIHANQFSDVALRAINAGGHTGRPYFRPLSSRYEASHIRIVANLFERIGDTPVAFVGCYQCVFANNTVVSPGRFVARILQENREKDPGGNGFFINNILALKQTPNWGSLIDVDANTVAESFNFGNNLWVSPKPGYKPRVPISLIGTNNIISTTNAGFRAPESGDYSLMADSPAIGRGRPVPGGLLGDFLGRPYSHPPSIGAYRRP